MEGNKKISWIYSGIGRKILMFIIWHYGGTEYLRNVPVYFANIYEDEWKK